jgi:hypothetical protein
VSAAVAPGGNVRPKGRRRLACYHEAGHCLARWFFGYGTDGAWVLTVDQVLRREWPIDDRGRVCEAEGAVERYDIVSPTMSLAMLDQMEEGGGTAPEWLASMRSEMPIAAEITMIESIAGPIAEARFRKCGLFVAIWQGGHGDMQTMTATAAAWFLEGERDIARRTAETRATALVRSPKGWAAITTIGEALFNYGRVEGHEIDTMCAAAFGREMSAFYGWMPHWPPTLEMLRKGSLPGELGA